MKYLKLDIERPVEYISGGRFVTEVPWTHSKRVIDSYELIIGVNETLYMEQDGVQYEVNPGQAVILLPHLTHRGYRVCHKNVSFYWFHFLCSKSLIDDQKLNDEILAMRTQPHTKNDIKQIYLSLFTTPSAIERLNILANQLLHVDNANYYTRMSMNYLMTSVLIELSEQTLSDLLLDSDSAKDDIQIYDIMEWTRIHATDMLSVSDIANRFNYHKDYLSRLFKRKTGITLQEYIHRMKLSKAKDLLTGTRLTVKEISYRVGIVDEKYFMRLFKKYEKITPTEYRRAFCKIHFNNH
ncbi:helix-turn-helix domain-containing protein [Caldalkalibacillus salinus]|uniref:helix-turn-helix domain-containing protein n=1 Tax=Caldalkalibacillus salinus TaxID=2803787 RepID=UPI0019231F89|nr:helix-turn-helix transcriptional regulator [Caldalkalibacillus salinus]